MHVCVLAFFCHGARERHFLGIFTILEKSNVKCICGQGHDSSESLWEAPLLFPLPCSSPGHGLSYGSMITIFTDPSGLIDFLCYKHILKIYFHILCMCICGCVWMCTYEHSHVWRPEEVVIRFRPRVIGGCEHPDAGEGDRSPGSARAGEALNHQVIYKQTCLHSPITIKLFK